MAVTLQARRIKGDQFTANDEIELLFNYTELGTMYEALTTIEVVSGVAVTHGGGAAASEYLHYKAYDLHGDDNGFNNGEEVIFLMYDVSDDVIYEVDVVYESVGKETI